MNIIVAMCKNRGIGINGMIPWSLKEDMRFFKNKTIGNGNNAVIMGRKTFESMSKTLPKRRNYIISSTKSNQHKKEDSVIYSDLIKLNYDIVTREHPYDDIWVIGGEQLYTWYINNNLVKYIYVTNILEEYDCDTFFPKIPNTYKKIGSGDVVVSKENKLRYNIDIYRNNFYDHKNETVKWCDFLKELDKIGYHGII